VALRTPVATPPQFCQSRSMVVVVRSSGANSGCWLFAACASRFASCTSLSGNNVGPIRDMTRRCISVRLSPQLEVPAARTFQRPDLVAEVLRRRGHYVSAALTIICAWIAAGRPKTVCKRSQAMAVVGSVPPAAAVARMRRSHRLRVRGDGRRSRPGNARAPADRLGMGVRLGSGDGARRHEAGGVHDR
jgi:hypothetical protein